MDFTKVVSSNYGSSIGDVVKAMPNGGILIIEPGEYEVCETIILPSNITIQGHGEVVIRGLMDAPVFQGKPCTNVRLINLHINMEAPTFTDTAVYFSNSSNVGLESVQITAAVPPVTTGNGFYCDHTGGVKLINCRVSGFCTNVYLSMVTNLEIAHGSYANSVGNAWGHDGILLERCTYSMVVNNTLIGNAEHGIYLSGCMNVKVAQNFITDNKGNGIRIGAHPEQNASHLHIRENTCEGNVNGINISDGCHHMLIVENYCNGNSNYGIVSDGVEKPHHNYYIQNFMTDNVSTAQFKILNLNSTIANNIIG